MDHDETVLPAGEIERIARRIDRPVVLVGMMGVGKSSVGKRLAAAIGCRFVDADDAIEESAQMSIAEIFETYGEAFFRDGERRVIARLLDENGGCSVIATGGGAFCQEDTRRLILQKAVAVWLDADLDTLVERTARKGNRPLLRGGDPREILARLRADREPHYAHAQIHVKSGAGPHHRVLSAVLRGLDQWL